MKVDWNSKYTTISVYSVITFAICFALVVIVSKFELISGFAGSLCRILSPIIWGVVIAYLLNPVMMGCEKLLKKVIERKKPHPKLIRTISTILSLLFGIAVIAAIIAIIVPQVIESLMNIFNSIPTYFNNIQIWFNKSVSKLSEYPDVVAFLNNQMSTFENTVMDTVNKLIPKMGDIALKIKDGAISTVVALKDFLIGFIVSVYLLMSKEKFLAGAKKLTIAVFPQTASKRILRICDKTNKSLSGFISGKILDSIIIGVFCFACMTIMNLEFPVLISTIVGITNIIPFFGPFIGAIPSALLLLVSAPKQTLPFIALIVVLQQIDGNIIGPKILGNTTGLPSFWVLFSILLGSGLFGFAGMILGVPIFAVIYNLIQEFSDNMLTKKGLSTNPDDYKPQPAVTTVPSEHKSFKLTKNNKKKNKE